MKFHVLTLGDVEDQTFYENPAVKKQLCSFRFSEMNLDNNSSNIDASNIVLSKEIAKSVSTITDNELIIKVIASVKEYEATGDFTKIQKTPLIPLMLCNSKDITKTIVQMSLNPGLPKKNLDYLSSE